jgi:hypothetical protein
MSAAALHQLIRAEDLVDGRPQRLGAVDDEQVAALGVEPLFPQTDQQIFHCGRVLGGAELNLGIPAKLNAHTERKPNGIPG